MCHVEFSLLRVQDETRKDDSQHYVALRGVQGEKSRPLASDEVEFRNPRMCSSQHIIGNIRITRTENE
jgi:hypothetical protein